MRRKESENIPIKAINNFLARIQSKLNLETETFPNMI